MLQFLFYLLVALTAAAPAAAQPSPSAAAPSGWQPLAWTGATPEARHESALVGVGDEFYLLGGRGRRRIQAFDPRTGRWRNTETYLDDVHHFQALAQGGRIYVLGALHGAYPNEQPVEKLLIYDPQTDRLTQGATVPQGRRRGAAGLAWHAGKMYLIGGNRNGHSAFMADGTTPANVAWLDAYDPATDRWEQLPDAPHARDHFQAVVVNNRLYVTGGRRSRHGTPSGPMQDTEAAVDVYDFRRRRWLTQTPPPLPTPRAGTSSLLWNGQVWVIGGETSDNNDVSLFRVEVLDPQKGTWQQADNLTLGRHATGAVLHEGKIYTAAGSKTAGGTEIQPDEPAFVEVYAP